MGQFERDLRALAQFGTAPDPTAMAQDDLLAGGEAKPRPGDADCTGRALERFEDAFGLVLRDADPAIGHLEDMPVETAFEAQEKRMLKALSQGERQMLFELMSKVVMDAQEWAGDLPPEAVTNREGTTQ